MHVVHGHSEEVDSDAAVAEVLDACDAALAGRLPQAGLLYAAIDHDFQLVLDAITARYPGIELAGCTTDGELSSSLGFAEDSLALILFQSDRVVMKAGIGRRVRDEPERASRDAVAMAREGVENPLRLCIANPAGLGVNMDRILRSLSESLGSDVPICGGLAGDQVRFDTTYQFYKNEVHTDSVPVLLFAGPLEVSTGVNSGFEPIGGRHRITRAESSVVYTIDDEPAKGFWTRYFGTREFGTYLHAMAVFPDESMDGGDDPNGVPRAGYGEFFLSTPSAFTDDDGMVMLNPVPEGVCMRFADASRDKLVEGAEKSIRQAQSGFPKKRPDAALVYSCAGRRAVMGMRIKEEHELLAHHLGSDVPVVGFYTYGEFCPLSSSNTPRSHGTTFVTVLLGES